MFEETNFWEDLIDRSLLQVLLIIGGVIAALIIFGPVLWAVYIRFVQGEWPAWSGLGGYTDAGGVQHPGKTLWDIWELLVLPVVIVAGGVILARAIRWAGGQIATRSRYSEQPVAAERMQETTLQMYLDRMTDLILNHHLRISEPTSEIRDVARAWTLSVLRGLDGDRKGLVLRFLYEAKLINKNHTVVNIRQADFRRVNLAGSDLFEADLSRIDFRGANLSEADLGGADLSNANLRHANLREAYLRYTDLRSSDLRGAYLVGANLREANLRRADLRQADLRHANLREANLGGLYLEDTSLPGIAPDGANLRGADLRYANLRGVYLRGVHLEGADLSGADLSGADISEEQLAKARSLNGATLPDGSRRGRVRRWLPFLR